MKPLLISLVSSLLATASLPAAPHNSAAQDKPAAKHAEPQDPVEQEYERIVAEDELAEHEVNQWIKDAQGKGDDPISKSTLNARIDQRFEKVRERYEKFIQEHPDHVAGRLAFGSFLSDTGEEEQAVAQWEKALQLDPKDPATWNNLANHYGHRGPIKKAFEYYAKAIELNPNEPVYLQNLATTVYLFRKDAKEYYHTDERGVFDRALDLYRKAMKLDPKNFVLATDYAMSYYGIKPLRTEEALGAWNSALQLATNNISREGVYLHLARIEIASNRFEEAQKHLNAVTNAELGELKTRLIKNLERNKKDAATNALPVAPKTPAASAKP